MFLHDVTEALQVPDENAIVRLLAQDLTSYVERQLQNLGYKFRLKCERTAIRQEMRYATQELVISGRSESSRPHSQRTVHRREASHGQQLSLHEDMLSELTNTLIHKTNHVDTKSLQALRTKCEQMVWGHRAEWDKSALLQELLNLVIEAAQDSTSKGISSDDLDYGDVEDDEYEIVAVQ
jgi:hypothetical protein